MATSGWWQLCLGLVAMAIVATYSVCRGLIDWPRIWELSLALVLSVGGGLVVNPLLHFVRARYGLPPEKGPGPPAWLVGCFERFFFTLVIAATGEFVAILVAIVVSWPVAKMGIGWAVRLKQSADQPTSGGAFVSLIGSLISIGFALLGGYYFVNVGAR